MYRRRDKTIVAAGEKTGEPLASPERTGTANGGGDGGASDRIRRRLAGQSGMRDVADDDHKGHWGVAGKAAGGRAHATAGSGATELGRA